MLNACEISNISNAYVHSHVFENCMFSAKSIAVSRMETTKKETQSKGFWDIL